MTCQLFLEHFAALFAQSNFTWLFFLVKFKKHLTFNFSRFFLFNLVLKVFSILPQPLIAFREFSSGSQLS